MAQIKILALAGSTREGSFNRKVLKIAIQGAQNAGGEIDVLDLRDYPLPLYNGDLEEKEGIPPEALQLRKLFRCYQGLLVASPEYNSSLTPLLKNTFDWISRTPKGEELKDPFEGKIVSLVAASPGALGGIRALPIVRSFFTTLKMIVLPDQGALPNAHKAFNEDGSLKEPHMQRVIEGVGEKLVSFLQKMDK